MTKPGDIVRKIVLISILLFPRENPALASVVSEAVFSLALICPSTSTAPASTSAAQSSARLSSTAASIQASGKETTAMRLRQLQAKKGGSQEAENLLRLERKFVKEKQAEAASCVGAIYRKRFSEDFLKLN